MSDPWANVPVEAAVLAQVLDAHEDYRVLRRVLPRVRALEGGVPTGSAVGIALHVGATGPDKRTDEIMELAVQRFRIDGRGRVIETGVVRSWLEEPLAPITRAATRSTGLNATAVAGRSISDGEATGMILDADFVVSYGAALSRPLLERRLPLAAGRPWVCARADFDWTERGMHAVQLQELLVGVGMFCDNRRAGSAVTALVAILSLGIPEGGTVVGQMVQNAAKGSWVVDAVAAPRQAEEVLRLRGYVWIAARDVWSVEVSDEAIGDEIQWSTQMLYGGRRLPEVRQVSSVERYA